jgi:hypothetical protein
MEQVVQNVLLALNMAGWQTGMAGGRNSVVYWARHRQTGQVLTSQGPAIHAEDAARWLAQRCGVAVAPSQPG